MRLGVTSRFNKKRSEPPEFREFSHEKGYFHETAANVS